MKKNRRLRKTLAENLIRFRAAKGLSQEQFAQLSGLHRTYVGSVERQERNVTLSTLEALSEAMGIPASELLKPSLEKPKA